MKYTIHRCMKKPGLIDRARTYFLELNDKGLYIIAIGKAGQEPAIRQDNLVNVTALALAKKINAPFAKKMEEEIVANEERLASGMMDQMSSEKNSYFIEKKDVQLFSCTQERDSFLKINIKGGKANIVLFADAGYLDELKAIEGLLKK